MGSVVVAEGDGPLIGWFVYRGATVFAETKPNRAALPVAIAATCAWPGMSSAGDLGLRMLVASGTAFVFILAAMRTLYPIARTNLRRLFVKSWSIPLVLVVLRPLLESAGVSPNGFVDLWMTPLVGIGLLVILIILEHHVEEARALAKQRSEHLRLGALVSSMGTWTLDLTTLKVKWSPELYRLHNLPTGTLDGEANEFLSFIAPEDSARFHEAMLEMIRTQANLDLEYRTNNVQGKPRYLHAQARYMKRTDGA